MIRVRDIGYRYPRARSWVFERHSFDVVPGTVFSILGPNGRGKTTLLKCVAGVLHPSTGDVSVSRFVGYVPQQFATPFAYTVRDIVVMGRARHIGLFGSPGRRDRSLADQAMEDLGIAWLADRLITSLSGGERQMVMIARALASGAEIMVLDEPTSALDFRNQAIVLAALERLSRQRGMTIVMTTHHPQHALEIADTALLMQGSDRYAVGPADEVLSEARLSDLYGLPIQAATVCLDGRRGTTMIPVLGGMRTDIEGARP